MDRSAVVSKIAHQIAEDAPRMMPAGRWWEELEEDLVICCSSNEQRARPSRVKVIFRGRILIARRG